MKGRRTYFRPLSPAHAGRSARRKALRPRRVLRALALVGLGSALGGAIYGGTVLVEWAAESETFDLKKIEVSGEEGIPEYEIVEAAGVERGVNILKVSLDRIERSVSSLPAVKRCFAERRLPGGLLIRVAPRRPYFLFNCGCVWRVDREGVLLGRASAEDLGSMFMAGGEGDASWRGSGAPEVEPAPGVMLDPEAVSRIVSAIRAIERYAPDLRAVVSEMCVTREGGLVLFTNDPPQRVDFGFEEPKAENIVALSAVLRDLSRRGLTGMEIDMRFDRQLVARPCGPNAAMRDDS